MAGETYLVFTLYLEGTITPISFRLMHKKQSAAQLFNDYL
jgi:uncharacterized DUF497 family protein